MEPPVLLTARRLSVLAMAILGLSCCVPANAFQDSRKTRQRGGESSNSEKSKRKSHVRLFGQVTDLEGNAVKAIQVQVMSPRVLSNIQTLTDDNGQYELHLELEGKALFEILLKVETDDRSLIRYASPNIDSRFIRDGVSQLDIQLQQPRDVEIVVVEENQFAVDDGAVCLFQGPNIALGVFSTGKNGIVQVTIPNTKEPWTIAAVKKEVGFSSIALPFVKPGEPIRPVKIVLEKALPMRVQLNDLEKKPVVGARVSVLRHSSDAQGMRGRIERLVHLLDLVSEETDDSGEAWLDAFPFGTITLTCRHHDYEAYSLTLNHDQGPEFIHHISLRNVATNRCLVVDEFGKPLVDTNIDVEISNLPIFENQIPNRTDESGMIEFSVVVGQPYMLTARMGGLGAAAITGFGVKEQDSGEVQTLRLKPLRTIMGTVRSEGSGKVVPNRKVYLLQLGAGLDEVRQMRGAESVAVWVRPTMSQQFTTDAEGRFRFVVPEGEFNLSLSPQENNSKRFRILADEVPNLDLTAREEN
jgi:hypothetical protein